MVQSGGEDDAKEELRKKKFGERKVGMEKVGTEKQEEIDTMVLDAERYV